MHRISVLLVIFGSLQMSACYASIRIEDADGSVPGRTDDAGPTGDGGSNPARACPMSASPGRLAADREHACAIGNDCALYCWGANAFGQLGLGDTKPREAPSRVAAGPWSKVTASAFAEIPVPGLPMGGSTCALDAAGKLYCWGGGYGETAGTNALSPRLVSPDAFQEIHGTVSMHLVSTDGRLLATGYRRGGILGLGGDANSGCTSPTDSEWTTGMDLVPDSAGFTGVVSGISTRCALRAGELHCWGANPGGVLEPTNSQPICTPRRIGTESDWEAVSPVPMGLCGLRRGGELYCWNAGGSVGVDPTAPYEPVVEPRRLFPDWHFVFVERTDEGACAVRDDHVLVCWGDGPSSLVPDPNATFQHGRAYVYEVAPSLRVAYFHAARGGVLVVTTDDAVYRIGPADTPTGTQTGVIQPITLGP